jgi:hypothetical protein
LLSIAQTYAKLVSSQEILLNENLNSKEKSEHNIKQLNELKRKLHKEYENLEEMKKNSAEIKIDIHNLKMKQYKPKADPEPTIIFKMKKRNPSLDFRNNMLSSYNGGNTDRKLAFQTEDSGKMCECNCLVF